MVAFFLVIWIHVDYDRLFYRMTRERKKPLEMSLLKLIRIY